MRLDGFGLIVRDMGAMVRFYRDVLGFEVRKCEDTGNVYLIKDGVLFLLRESGAAESAGGASGLAGHVEIALSAGGFEDVDRQYVRALEQGAAAVLAPATESWGQRACRIADPEGNLIEISAFGGAAEADVS